MIIQSITGKSNTASTPTNNSTASSRIIQPITSKSTNNPGYIAPKSTPVKVSQPPKTNLIANVKNEVTNDIVPNVVKGAGVAAEAIKKFAIKNYSPTIKAAKDLAIDPNGLKFDPKKTLENYVNGIKDSTVVAGNNLRKVFTNDTKKAPSASERVGAGLQTVASTTGALLSPITGLFTAAKNVPGFTGHAAKLIDLAFTFLGDSGSAIGERYVDELNLPKQVKENIKPGVKEIFALATQMVGGHALDAAGRGKLIDKYGVQDAVTIETKAKELATKKASELKPGENTPEEVINHVVSNKIEKTPKGKEMLKTAIEAQKEGATINVEHPQEDVANQPIADIKPKVEVKPQEGLKPSKIGKSIEQKAVDAKLTERFSETAGYTPITIKEQSARATTLVNSSIDEARAIVRGEKPLPENLRGTALITAMEEHIKNNPNTDLAYELANSPLVSGTSAAAQELRLAAERTPDSATARLAEIKQAREKAITDKGQTIKQATTDTIKEIQKRVKVPDKYDWGKFVDSIVC